MKDYPLVAKICADVTKYAIYVAVVLTPVLFAPWTADPLDFTKQAALVLVVFVALFAWMLGILVSGKLTFSVNKVHLAAGILLIVYLASTLFSVSRYGSFWGWPSVTSASFLSLLCFLILYVLVSSTFDAKRILYCCKLLGASSLLVFVYGILQILGLHVLPFAFAKSNAFTTIGSVAGLGVFAAMMLPLCICLIVLTKRWWQAVFAVNVAAILALVLLINYAVVWWVVVAGCATLVLFWILKRETFDTRWVFLPMFFLIISLFFVAFNPQIKWLPQKPLEVRLTHETSFGIALKSFMSSPLLGSGPGTFAFDFAKYKSKDFNKSPLWDTTAYSGSSQALTDFATLGLLGFVAFVAFIGLAIFYVVKHLISHSSTTLKKGEQALHEPLLVIAALAVVAAGTAAYFLHVTNVSFGVVYFLCLGILVALVLKEQRFYLLASSSVLNLAVTFVGTGMLVFGLGLLLLEGQRYAANIHYNTALAYWQSGNRQESIQRLKAAANTNASVDTYFKQLAVFSLVDLQTKVSSSNINALSNAEAKKIQSLVTDAVNASNITVKLNGNSADNWSMKGYVCQNVIGFAPDALTCAIASYDKAIALSPTNPYLVLQQGNAYLAAVINANLPASLQGSPPQDKAQLLAKAKTQFESALALKPDYALAYVQLAQVAKLQNNPSGRLTALENAAQYSGNDPNLALQIGLIYYQDKNWAKARSQFQRALSLVPTYANAMYYLGLTYDHEGQREKALTIFLALLKTDPNNVNIKKIVENLRAAKPALDGLGQQPPLSASEIP